MYARSRGVLGTKVQKRFATKREVVKGQVGQSAPALTCSSMGYNQGTFRPMRSFLLLGSLLAVLASAQNHPGAGGPPPLVEQTPSPYRPFPRLVSVAPQAD